jgi:putative peptidoglycan lipid II flippase
MHLSLPIVNRTDSRGPSLARASAVMALGIGLSRFTGLLRIAAATAAVGVVESRLADAYNIANAVPLLVYELMLGGIMTSVVVPVLVELIEEDRERAWRIATAFINLALIGLTLVTVIVIAAAPWIAQFYSGRMGGAEGDVQKEAITLLLRLLVPQIIFFGLAGITAGLLNAHRRFAVPMYTPVLNNVAVIVLFISFYNAFGKADLNAGTRQLTILGLGTTLGVVLMALAQLPFLREFGRYSASISVPWTLLKKIIRLSLYIFGYVLISQVGYLFMQWLASAEQGGYSAFVVAYTFFLVPISLVGYSVSTALLPDMSSHASNDRWTEFRDRVSVGVRVNLFLLLPAAVGYLVLGREILRVLLLNGVMTVQSVDLIWHVLALMTLGLPQAAIFSAFVRAFYAMQDARSPFLIVSAVVVLNAVLNVPLFIWLGVKGLALGQAIALTAATFISGRSLSGRISGIDARRALRSGLRCLLASLGMGATVWAALQPLERYLATGSSFGATVSVAALGVLGAGVYLALAWAMKVEEVVYLRKLSPFRSGTRDGPTGPLSE